MSLGSYISNMMSEDGKISHARHMVTIIYLTACVIAIVRMIKGITAQDVAMVSTLLSAGTILKGWQKKLEVKNKDEKTHK